VAEFDQAVELIRQADRPVIIVGNGARGRMEPIIALAEHLNAPVITTFKGKGLISDAHPLAAGVLGRSGTPVASWLMNEGTLQIVFGASFSDHTGIDSYTPTIQVDTDPESLGRFQAVTVPLLGEVATTAQMFRDAVGDGGWVDQRNDIAARWHIWRFEKQRRAKDDRGEGLASAAIFAALSDAVPADAVIAVDVGNNTYSFGRYFESKQQDVLMSGYLGSIGFAFPAAMGAWAAVHDRGEQRDIVAIAGDGGFGQYLADFTTAVKYGMNITLVLIHNGQLGKISKEQRAVGDPVWQTSLVNPDFSEYARLCGGWGRRVEAIGDLDAAVREGLSYDGPAIVEVMADAELI
jgi:thiamine pyrophosphate-dependent acetolactate synthase large subunit-like protein